MKNVIFDSQVLSTLMSCPRLTDFKFNRNFTAISGKSPSMEMGSIVHKFLEVYYRGQIQGISKEMAEGNAYTSALAYSQSDEVRNSTPEDIQWALETCNQYLEYYRNDFWVPLEVETVKQEMVYEDDEIRVMWKAKFDLISDTNQGIYPIDHKTMKQRRDTLSINNQFMGQCILMKTRLMFVNKIGFQKSLKAAEKFTRATINYTFDTLLEWQSVILPYYAKLYLMYAESEYWPPNFTHCENKFGNCQFVDVCSADRNVREELIGQDFIVGEAWNPQTEE